MRLNCGTGDAVRAALGRCHSAARTCGLTAPESGPGCLLVDLVCLAGEGPVDCAVDLLEAGVRRAEAVEAVERGREFRVGGTRRRVQVAALQLEGAGQGAVCRTLACGERCLRPDGASAVRVAVAEGTFARLDPRRRGCLRQRLRLLLRLLLLLLLLLRLLLLLLLLLLAEVHGCGHLLDLVRRQRRTPVRCLLLLQVRNKRCLLLRIPRERHPRSSTRYSRLKAGAEAIGARGKIPTQTIQKW